MTPPGTARPPRRVNPRVELAAAYGWRFLVLAAVVVGVVWLLQQLWVVLLASIVGLFIARALDRPLTWFRARGLPPALAATAALLGFVAIVALVGWFVVPRVADEFESLGPTISEALDDLERWLVDDSPFDVTQEELDDLRERVGDSVSDAIGSSGESLLSGAVVVLEVITGLILAFVAAWFFMKDGPRFQRAALGWIPEERRPLVRRMASRGWSTVGGYLMGAAALGAIEGTIMGVTLFLVGAELGLPVGVLTFVAAFVPFVGAIVAGVVAVLVALATAGFGAAVIVAIVALVVQQLDNDLLAPVVYGRALQLHPLVILFAVVAGSGLFGFAGAVLAVPVVAVVLNVVNEAGVGPPHPEVDAAAHAAGGEG